MTTKQLAILNSLVTYAAENVPGGLSEDEQEVAKIVGQAAWHGDDVKLPHGYEYAVINCSHYDTVQAAANAAAKEGWRVVAAIGSQGPGYADSLVIERHVLDPKEEIEPERKVPVHLRPDYRPGPDYQPVFVGRTEDDEKIVIYKNPDANPSRPDGLFLLRPDGELWAMSPDSTVSRWVDVHDKIHIHITSPEWTGDAVGTQQELREEQAWNQRSL